MHCPNCGHKISAEQKFCRGCGMSLEKVVQLLGELSPAVRQSAQGAREQQLKRLAERAGTALLAGAGAVFFLAVCWAIILKIIIRKGEWLEGGMFLALLIALVGGGLLLSYSASARKSALALAPEPPALQPDEHTARLLSEPPLEPVPSVTERTTELLTVERRADTTEVN